MLLLYSSVVAEAIPPLHSTPLLSFYLCPVTPSLHPSPPLPAAASVLVFDLFNDLDLFLTTQGSIRNFLSPHQLQLHVAIGDAAATQDSGWFNQAGIRHCRLTARPNICKKKKNAYSYKISYKIHSCQSFLTEKGLNCKLFQLDWLSI